MAKQQEKYPFKEIGNKLKAFRGDKKQYEIARALGIAVTTYNRYEKGRTKIPEGLFSLAERIAQDDSMGAGIVKETKSLYAVTQEVEIDGKKHTLKLHAPEGEARKLPPPEMAIQNALNLIEKYVDELRKKDAEIAKLRTQLQSIIKEEPPSGIEERRRTWIALKKILASRKG